MPIRHSPSVWSPQLGSVAKGVSGELDQSVVLLRRQYRLHVEDVLEDGLLQLALRKMNLLHGALYTFRIDFVRQQRFGQLSICLTNRRDKFIPAPSELSFDRFELTFLFRAKTQLAVNPMVIINWARGGLAQEVIGNEESAGSDTCA
jgi:hypothetical protein